MITSPFSFVASANCILFERAKPVFVDIDPSPTTSTLRESRAPLRLEPKQFFLCMYSEDRARSTISLTSRKHGLTIIEDACEAIGAKYHGAPVGTSGQTGVFAFYPNKQLTTGEGGVLVTDDLAIAHQCRSWRNQGRADSDGWFEHDSLGYNYRLSDINCALGITQLARLDEVISARAIESLNFTTELCAIFLKLYRRV